MKPIRLEIVGFGPYAAPAIIHFEELDPLFLVSGDTGAGKTSLFDAMCFALYGKPLGTREKEGLRSQHATEETPTSVSLEWEVSGTRWRVFRGPHLPRPKKRGTGVTVEESTTLERRGADGVTWESQNLKPAQINARIESEILGLSHEEFSKILVLPQGEFQRFLEMESKDRAGLLEKLFPTSLHKRIAELAKASVAGIAEQVTKNEGEQTALRKQFDPEGAAERAQKLQALIEAARATADASRVVAKAAADACADGEALVTAQVERARCGERLATLGADEPRIADQRARVARSRAATRCIHHAEQVDTLGRQIAKRTLERDGFAAKIEVAAAAREQHRPAVEALGEREVAVARRVGEQQKLRQRITDLGMLKAARKKLADAQDLLAKAQKAMPTVTAAEQTARKTVEDLDGVAARRQEHQPALREAEAQVLRLDTLTTDAARIDAWETTGRAAAETERRAAEGKLAQARNDEKVASSEAKRTRAAVDGHAAVQLASALVDGAPCPVCGSDAHPHPASGQLALIDLHAAAEAADVALEAARKLTEAQQQLVSTLVEKQRAHAEYVDEGVKRLSGAGYPDVATFRQATLEAAEQLEQRRGVDASFARQLAERPARAQALEAAVKALTAATAHENDARYKVATATTSQDEVAARVGDTTDPEVALVASQAEADELEQSIDAENSSIRAIRDASQQRDVALAEHRTAFEQAVRDLTARAAELAAAEKQLAEALLAEQFADATAARASALSPDAEKRLDDDANTWTAERDRTVGQLEALDRAIAGRPAPDLDALRAAVTAANAERDRAVGAQTTAERDLTDLVAHRARWEALLAEHARLHAESRGVVQLSRDLNGDNALRIDFSTFVLGAWLDHVLERGSRRLQKLSDGRYRFQLHSEPADKRKRAGLDIDVWDAHTNGVRNVRTLSGGEKFLASLSLALGLSDVIQERSGGIELDTLFIDEGFGSLDPATLDRAMQVLDEIGQHRRVGVISHVDAMKKTIPCQIEVVKGPNGSFIRA